MALGSFTQSGRTLGPNRDLVREGAGRERSGLLRCCVSDSRPVAAKVQFPNTASEDSQWLNQRRCNFLFEQKGYIKYLSPPEVVVRKARHD